MCTNYTPTRRDRLLAAGFGLREAPPDDGPGDRSGDWPDECFPGYPAPIVVAGDDGAPRLLRARFGLVPPWVRDAAQATDLLRRTCNARGETASVKPSFRAAWRERRYALVPAEDFFEPCWDDPRRAVRWRIRLASREVLAIAALWERWTDPASGEIVHSFAMLTCNADGHAVMGRFHRPGDEKRTPVLLPPADWPRWLAATPANAAGLLRPPEAALLHSEPAPRVVPPRTAGVRPTAGPVNGDLFSD